VLAALTSVPTTTTTTSFFDSCLFACLSLTDLFSYVSSDSGKPRDVLTKVDAALRKLWKLVLFTAMLVSSSLAIQTWELVETLRDRGYGRNHIDREKWTVHATRYSWLELSAMVIALWYSWLPLEPVGIRMDRYRWYRRLRRFVRSDRVQGPLSRCCNGVGLGWLFFPAPARKDSMILSTIRSISTAPSGVEHAVPLTGRASSADTEHDST